ncbi:MAG: SMP-30/gluconolactonase/LRE family protein, partial [Pirellulales bacterium]
MFHRVDLVGLQLILLLGNLPTVGCAKAQAPSDDEAAVQEAERGANTRPGGPGDQSLRKSELLVQLPAGCNTPDAMALLPDGNIVLSMPNFNDLEEGSRLMRITPDNQVETFLELPKHPNTGKPIGPLGVCVAPSGDLFLADYQMTGERQSRVLKIAMQDGKPGSIEPVVTGFHVSNAVICRNGYLYVSETQIDTKSKPATSGVFRFSLDELEKGPVALTDKETEDPHFLATIQVHNEELPLGADGLCFDATGNLYIGNFADGTVHRFEFDAAGKVKSNSVFARADCMKSADGLFLDKRSGVIYVADSKANAVQMVLPGGSVMTLAQNGDTDGLDDGMHQPCE